QRLPERDRRDLPGVQAGPGPKAGGAGGRRGAPGPLGERDFEGGRRGPRRSHRGGRGSAGPAPRVGIWGPPMEAKIVVLGGDGIGPEITNVAVSLLRAVAHKFGHTFHFDEQLIGGIAIDKTGSALPDATLAACKDASAVLLGAVGGPKWDDPAAKVRPEQGLLAIRKGLGLYANLRPVLGSSRLLGASPLKREVVEGVDRHAVRELTGGLYLGTREEATGSGPDDTAYDTMIY